MTRRPLVPEAKKGLDKLKNEFGIEINDSYNGNKTSKSNGHIGGSIGGLMTKKMIESYEKSLVDKQLKS